MATRRRVIIPPLGVLVVLGAVGCGDGDKCKKACKKIERCQKQNTGGERPRDDTNTQNPAPYGGSSTLNFGCSGVEKGECTPRAECQAECVLDATCDQILGNAATLMSCMVKCLSSTKGKNDSGVIARDSGILAPIGQDSGPGCTPSCSGKQCGDDGCGGSCGTCSYGETCSFGVCVPSCTPSCSGKECGDDGCGGSCGTCSYGKTCNSYGQCVSSQQPSCTSSYCGSSSAVPGSSPSCYCDSQCKSNGDCCPGYDAVCGGAPSGTNSGKTCDQQTPCSSTSEQCLQLQGWTKGMCFGQCSKQGDICPTADAAKYMSICALTDQSQTQWYCLYVCEVQGQTYQCPDPYTQSCVASSTAGVKVCQPK